MSCTPLQVPDRTPSHRYSSTTPFVAFKYSLLLLCGTAACARESVAPAPRAATVERDQQRPALAGDRSNGVESTIRVKGWPTAFGAPTDDEVFVDLEEASADRRAAYPDAGVVLADADGVLFPFGHLPDGRFAIRIRLARKQSSGIEAGKIRYGIVALRGEMPTVDLIHVATRVQEIEVALDASAVKEALGRLSSGEFESKETCDVIDR